MAGNSRGSRSDYRTMRCDMYRTALSARLDGEELGLDPWLLDRHLEGCRPCRAFRDELGPLNRSVRVRAAEQVPDLTRQILASRTPEPMPTARGEWVRYALLAVALTMVVVAIPALLTPLDGGESHLARESGGWSAALGVALLVVAWQPRRARGLLPLAAALAGVMVVAAAVDVVAGDAALAGESTHLLELAALGLLWLEARLAPRSDGHALRAN